MHEHSASRLDIHYQIDAVLSSVTSSCTPTRMPALQRHSIKNHPSDSIKSRVVFYPSFSSPSVSPSPPPRKKKGRDTINKIRDNLIRGKNYVWDMKVNFHAFTRETGMRVLVFLFRLKLLLVSIFFSS